MQSSNLDKKVLALVFSSANGLHRFTIFKRLLVAPSELFLSLKRLEEQELIVITSNNKILLSKVGFQFVVRHKISLYKNSDKYTSIPKQFLASKKDINEFYIPKIIKDFS